MNVPYNLDMKKNGNSSIAACEDITVEQYVHHDRIVLVGLYKDSNSVVALGLSLAAAAKLRDLLNNIEALRD